jgi:hypothetical protein
MLAPIALRTLSAMRHTTRMLSGFEELLDLPLSCYAWHVSENAKTAEWQHPLEPL